MTRSSEKLQLSALIALVTGSILGSGIYSLPQNIAIHANVGAVLIGWLITAIGMLSIAFVFQTLANRKPELNSGIYAYAKAGFGDYMGFSSAWGYWISAWLGNVSYLVLLFSTLGYFFPLFGAGNTTVAICCASILLWSTHFLILRGIKEAALINQIATFTKIGPILFFIFVAIFSFKQNIFNLDIWGNKNPALGSVIHQIRNVMLITVWVFIGIEGASVYSGRAKNRTDIGKATIIGFIIALLLLVLVNILSFGIMSQSELAQLKNPSMSPILEHIIGYSGKILISFSLIISLLSALISWILLCAEIMFVAAKDSTMPYFLQTVNANYVPKNALWLTNSIIQIFLILTLYLSSTYLSLIYLATSMILMPYFLSATYALMLAIKGETYSKQDKSVRRKDILIAILSVLYSLWLLFAGGVKYLLLSSILYTPGVVFFAKAKYELNQPIFTKIEKLIFLIIFFSALIAGYGLYTGFLTL